VPLKSRKGVIEPEPRLAPLADSGPTGREVAWAALVFAVATVLLSYPLAFHPATFSRLDNGDARLNAWAISWVAHQLLEDPLALFEANTFYPLPHTLAYSEHLTLQGILAIPLLALTDDLVLTNNFILLFSMFASGLGMYFLAYALTRDHLAAILAGIFFSFAPFRFNRLPHLQMQLYAFIPLFLAGLHRYAETHRPRWLVLAATAFVLQALSGTYLGAIAAVALGVALITLFPYAGLSRREWGYLLAALIAMAAVLVPFALPYLWVNRELGVEWDLSGLGSLSATPQAYLASSSHLYRSITEALTSPEGRTDFLFPGFTLITLGGTGLATLVKKNGGRTIGVCYAAIFLTGIILSLGPATPIHPFLYEHVVFFRGLRALTRFSLLPLLSLSVFSAYGLAWLLEGVGRRKTIFGAILVFFVVESTALPYRLEPHRDAPPEVYRWLRDAEPGPIVELPFKVVDTRYMFWARHHNFRPMLNGDSGFIPMSHQWLKVALGRFPSPDAIAVLRHLEVRYVVLHLGAFRKPALLRLLSGIETQREALLPVRDFGTDIVFEVLPDPTRSKLGAKAPALESVPVSGSIEALFDGVTAEPFEAKETVLELEVELEELTEVAGLRFHYGPVPRTPVVAFELFFDDASAASGRPGTRGAGPPDWPAVAALIEGLIETPLNGTQTISLAPFETARLRLKLRGIDGRPPALSEIEVLTR